MEKRDVSCVVTASDITETGNAVKQQWKTGTQQPSDRHHSLGDGKKRTRKAERESEQVGETGRIIRERSQ